MALALGTRLGAYEILTLIGSGGMGEVYRAKDTKLGREVALKILPAEFTSDPDRPARFRREAQVLASLNHPHIAQIHGLDECAGWQFLVLELVDGESLHRRIARGRIPVDDALGIAKQIAEALEAAHEKGIIHRDLKPANIALASNGNVKVLDFGLAKATEPPDATSHDVTNSPTITTPAMMTGVGVMLGTAAYMSPEQAKGKPADKRSDVWAFGCVLYEMLTGTRAFDGEDVSDTVAAVLRGTPDWTALPRQLSEPLRSLIVSCLQRDPSLRIPDIVVVRYVLEHTGRAAPPTQATRRVSPVLVGAAAVALVLIAGAAGWTMRWPPPAAKPVTRFQMMLGQDQLFGNSSAQRHLVAMSRDGSHLVYVADYQLYLRSFDQLAAAPIRGTAESPFEPFFSPDGQWVGYWAAGHLKKVAIGDGAPVTLCDAKPPFGAVWDGDRIVFGAGAQGILEVPAAGGTPRVLVSADSKRGEFLHGPQLMPGGDAVVFTVGSASAVIDRWSEAEIVAQSLKSGERQILVHGGTDGRYLPTGHLVYARDGVLFANAFDPARLELRGGPTSVVDGVAQSAAGQTGAVQFTVSDTRSIAYVPAAANTTRRRCGRATAGGLSTRRAGARTDRRIYFGTRQTEPASRNRCSAVRPTRTARSLPTRCELTDSRSCTASVYPADIMTIMVGQGEGRPLIAQPQFAERGGDLSPDGRWIAYYSDESGVFQVYVRPFPAVESGRWQVSSDGGSLPGGVRPGENCSTSTSTCAL